MGILSSKPTTPLRPLVRADGELDRAALQAWFDDMRCYKIRAGAELLSLGVAEGDLLVTDPEAPLSAGDVVALTDLDSGTTYFGRVERGEDGRLSAWSAFGHVIVEPDAEDGMDLLVQRLEGVVPMGGADRLPRTKDLAAARRLHVPPYFVLGSYPAEELPF